MSSEETGDSSHISEPKFPITAVQEGYSYSNQESLKHLPEAETQITAETGDVTVPDSSQDKKPAANPDPPSDITSPSTPDDPRLRPRQVIAVSASKGPAAFFNLARKFLVTDEMCDLSALEGAIVSAADAAHLLERSKLATIVRIQTSYVTVEPKRKRQVPSPPTDTSGAATPSQPGTDDKKDATSSASQRPSPTRELRRARIIITVKRTESYKKWLEENPLQASIVGDIDDVDDDDHALEATSQQLR